MEYRTGRLTITADDVAAWAALALRSLRQRFRPQPTPPDPTARLAAAAQQELATAHELLTLNQVRAAGAVAGVALELHLKHLAQTHGVDVRSYATIAQMQDTLYCIGILTRSECRVIDKLSAIRNCQVSPACAQ